MKKPEVIISEEDISRRIAELGAEISHDFEYKALTVVGLLKGSFVFMADLVRHIELNMYVEFLEVSSYGDGLESSGIVTVHKTELGFLKGKHVLIVEDIIDSGRTITTLHNLIKKAEPTSLRTAALLTKPGKIPSGLHIDYVGFRIRDDDYAVGYGMDAGGLYRNLRYIGKL
jgi:hypoxanthine phosphoribosyltransferase